MARFSYIPLDFQNIDRGLERELVLKKDTDDLYVLDDYKVPVSSTKNLKNDVSLIEDNINNLVTSSQTVVSNTKIEKNKAIDNIKTLDRYISECENDHFKRINALSDYQKYLDTFRNEISLNFNDIKSKINDTVNTYYSNLDSIISSIESKYNNNLSLYNTYVIQMNTYNRVITTMENEIVTLENKLKLKLKKLGSGSGSYDGSYTKTETVTKQRKTWFRWLSNSNVVYPGDRRASSFEDGLFWANYSDPSPLVPSFFVTTNPDGTDPNISEFKGPDNDVNKYLVRCYWQKNYVDSSGFTSTDGYFNKYGKEVACIYQRDFSQSIKVPVHIDI